MNLSRMLAALIALGCSPAASQEYTYEKWPVQQAEWLYFDQPVQVEAIWRDRFDEADMTFRNGVTIMDAQDTYTIICKEWDEPGNQLNGYIWRWSDDFIDQAQYAAAWYLLNERGSPFTMLQWAEACARHDMTD